jgi:hypothetical protein
VLRVLRCWQLRQGGGGGGGGGGDDHDDDGGVGAAVLGTALSLTIPLSMLADWVFKSETPTAFLWGGSVCVIVGFVSVSWDRKKDTTPAVTVAADSATIDTT